MNRDKDLNLFYWQHKIIKNNPYKTPPQNNPIGDESPIWLNNEIRDYEHYPINPVDFSCGLAIRLNWIFAAKTRMENSSEYLANKKIRAEILKNKRKIKK